VGGKFCQKGVEIYRFARELRILGEPRKEKWSCWGRKWEHSTIKSEFDAQGERITKQEGENAGVVQGAVTVK